MRFSLLSFLGLFSLLFMNLQSNANAVELTSGVMPRVHYAKLVVNDEKLLIDLQNTVMSPGIKNEPGTIAIYRGKLSNQKDNAKDIHTYYFIEFYDGLDGYNAHIQGSPYKEYITKSKDSIVDKKLIQTIPSLILTKVGSHVGFVTLDSYVAKDESSADALKHNFTKASNKFFESNDNVLMRIVSVDEKSPNKVNVLTGYSDKNDFETTSHLYDASNYVIGVESIKLETDFNIEY